jgi:hypothetical protein
MHDQQAINIRLRLALFGFGAASLIGVSGCQSTYGGVTLPSPWYLRDDVQYAQPGPEFKLAREAAAQKAYQEDQATASGPVPGPPVPGPGVPGPGVPAPPGPGPGGPPPQPPAGAGANLFTPRYW